MAIHVLQKKNSGLGHPKKQVHHRRPEDLCSPLSQKFFETSSCDFFGGVFGTSAELMYYRDDVLCCLLNMAIIILGDCGDQSFE